MSVIGIQRIPMATKNGDEACTEGGQSSPVGIQDGMSRSLAQEIQTTTLLPTMLAQTTHQKRRREDNESRSEKISRRKFQKGGQYEREELAEGKFPCPYRVRYPGRIEFETCPTYMEWKRLREHLIARKHRPRDLCKQCGMVFIDPAECQKHTGSKDCSPRPRGVEAPICTTVDQAARIKSLSTQGRRDTMTVEERYRTVWNILFGESDEPFLGSRAWHSIKSSTCSAFSQSIANLHGMGYVPIKDRIRLALQCYELVGDHFNQATPSQSNVNDRGTNELNTFHVKQTFLPSGHADIPLSQDRKGFLAPPDGPFVLKQDVQHRRGQPEIAIWDTYQSLAQSKGIPTHLFNSELEEDTEHPSLNLTSKVVHRDDVAEELTGIADNKEYDKTDQVSIPVFSYTCIPDRYAWRFKHNGQQADNPPMLLGLILK